MIRFSIDYLNPSSFYKSLDYSNKVILSAVSDPLFIYDKLSNSYVCNACKSYFVKGRKITINLRDDLFFSDGSKVTAKDYIRTIKENAHFLNGFKQNINSIRGNNNSIVVCLNKKDKSIINKLSCYFFSPHTNNTCGRYYICDINDYKIMMKPNKNYRNRSLSDLSFSLYDTFDDDKQAFIDLKTDISNNTFFELKNDNINNEKSGIIIGLEISTKYCNSERKKIINSINKNELVKLLGNAYYVKNDFYYNYNSCYKYNRIKNKTRLKIRLMYNKFYPNYQIATIIKNQLEDNNYLVDLVEENYDDYKSMTNYDIKLVLNYFEYIDDYYFYGSQYFNYIMKNNIVYRLLVKRRIFKKVCNYLFKAKYIKEPLISFYSNYNTNDLTSEFSYLECNYDKLR